MVSKGEYLWRHLFRVSGKGAGIVVQAGAVIWAAVVPLLFLWHFDVFQHNLGSTLFLVAVMLMATIVGIGWMLIREVGIKVVQRFDKIDTGIPLTRANVVHLPVPESLVRASIEPVQAQQATLLRAAEGMEYAVRATCPGLCREGVGEKQCGL